MSNTRLSKYDQHKQKQQEAQYHSHNIKELEAQLAEARDVLRVMPHDESNLELMAERREVSKHIEQLEEWLADERACIAEATYATPEQMEQVMRSM